MIYIQLPWVWLQSKMVKKLLTKHCNFSMGYGMHQNNNLKYQFLFENRINFVALEFSTTYECFPFHADIQTAFFFFFFRASSFIHCLAALDLGAGVE